MIGERFVVVSSELYRTHCESCGSSDGNVVYDDGHAYCFVCETTTTVEGGDTIEKEFKDETFESRTTVPISKTIRGISPSIFTQYNYFKDTQGNHIINHYNKNGELVAQKTRYPDKSFAWTGKAKEAVPFGLNQWRSGGKRIYITEGELDCLSIAEATGGKYPVISINNGAAAARRDLSKHLEFLSSYEEVVLWFDNDDPGRKATQEVASLFRPGQVYTCGNTTHKDANDLLKSGGKAAVLKTYYELKTFAPDGIVNANDGGFDEFIADSKADEVYQTPFKNLTISKGAITTIVSGSGMGKSTLTKEIGYDLLMNKELVVGHVALEENNAVSKRAYIGINLNQQLMKKTNWMEFKAEPENLPKLKEAYETVIGTGRLFLYNHFGSLDSDNLLSKLRYLALGACCDIIILDHISIVVSGLDDMGDNERRAIDVLMTKLRSLVEETGVGMILVSHLKRPPGEKGHEDGVQVRLAHLRGSGSIAQLSDEVIGLEGDQQDEALSNMRKIRRLKDREGGETGVIARAQYFKEEGRLLDVTEDGESFEDESKEEEF